MNIAPLANPTPRTRFQESGDSISKHRDMVDSTTFQRSCDFTMLEYSRVLAQETGDPNSAIVNALRLRGAHEFLSMLRNISEKPAEPKITPMASSLNHRA